LGSREKYDSGALVRISAQIQNLGPLRENRCLFLQVRSQFYRHAPGIIFVAGNRACCISNNVRDAYGSRDQRGLRNGADVQIGGGVRVGDAFQAIVGSKFIAI